MREVEQVATKSLFKAAREYAEQQKDGFVQRIEDQAFASFQAVYYPESGTNLSPRTLRAKEAAGADLRTMIATHWYKAHLRVFTKQARTKDERTVIRIGFHPDVKPRDLEGKPVDVEIRDLGLRGLNAVAMVHELGSIKAGIPARPHWQPYLDTMHRHAPKTRAQLRERVKQAIAKQLGRRVVVR